MLCSHHMRLTVHLPDDLARLLKQTALNEGKSMSALTAEALDFYLRERRRRVLGLKVLERAGKAPVDPKALEALEEGRRELDRL
jgi:metal-responsive CopG/Arc/MetJ family transcriptional regulator